MQRWVSDSILLSCVEQGGQKCGQSNNFWEYYEDDIKRVVSLQSTCFRLSLGGILSTSLQIIVRASVLAAPFQRPKQVMKSFFDAEWSRIEPEEGKIDMEAVKHYHDIFDCLLRCATKGYFGTLYALSVEQYVLRKSGCL